MHYLKNIFILLWTDLAKIYMQHTKAAKQGWGRNFKIFIHEHFMVAKNATDKLLNQKVAFDMTIQVRTDECLSS